MGGRWPNSRQKHRGKTSRDALYIANSTNAKLTANSYFKLLFFFRFSLRCCCALLLRPLGSCTQARFLHRILTLSRSPPPASSLQPSALPAASISPSPSPPPHKFWRSCQRHRLRGGPPACVQVRPESCMAG